VPTSKWRRLGLSIRADMFYHSFEIDSYCTKKLYNLAHLASEFCKVSGHDLGSIWRYHGLMALQYRIKIGRGPTESDGQRLQGPWTAAALHSMPMNFPHRCQRYMRTIGKFALLQPKLAQALIDGPGNRHPIVRHSHPPRLVSAQTLADLFIQYHDTPSFPGYGGFNPNPRAEITTASADISHGAATSRSLLREESQ